MKAKLIINCSIKAKFLHLHGMLLKVCGLTLFPCPVLVQLVWGLFNCCKSLVKLFKDFFGRVILIVGFFISHNFLNVAHSLINFERNSNSLSDWGCVLNTKADKISHLLEFLYVGLADRCNVNFINELDDPEWLSFFLAVDRAYHKVANASLLSLVVNFVNKVGFFFRFIAVVELARLKDATW
jgi:hypothetical protein